MRVGAWVVLVLFVARGGAEEAPPVSERTAAIRKQLEPKLAALNGQIAQTPDTLDLYSRRGDVHFFLADFPKALADYNQMVALDRDVLPLHWRRGLALYYIGEYDESAKQFERYYEHDQSDRENGIWRFYAHAKKYGLAEARKKLLPYEKPDRAPLPDIYDLCAGKLTAAEFEQKLAEPNPDPARNPQRDFYGHLYLGLDYALQNHPVEARKHLEQALSSEWAQASGYGPNYMWQIARLELDRLPAAKPAP
jgi:lipoprotein NlpI